MKKVIYLALLVLGVALMAAPPAMAQDDKDFTVHGEVRWRGESTTNTFDFDDNGDDSFGYWPYRIRLAAHGKVGNANAWVEFQNAGVAGAEQGLGVFPNPFRNGSTACDDVFFGACDGDGAELYQAYIELPKIWWPDFTARIGRQEIVKGTELLLGDLDFYSGISHDGMVGTWNKKKYNLTLLYTIVSEGSENTFQANLPPFLGSGDSFSGVGTTQFYGGYITFNIQKTDFDAYLLDLKSAGLGVDIMTFGARWSSPKDKKDGLFWNIELALQTGDVDDAAGVDAGGQVIEGWLGYTFNKAHSVFGKYVSAQGDDGGTADENEGFVPLFGDFHNRLGRGDWFQIADNFDFGGVGTGGIDAFAVGYKFHPNDTHSIGAAFWDYSINETAGDDAIGSALDVWYDYNASKNLTYSLALSQFSPDDAYTGGVDDAARRLYGQARLRW
jgi:hypothetical protein